MFYPNGKFSNNLVNICKTRATFFSKDTKKLVKYTPPALVISLGKSAIALISYRCHSCDW